MNKLHILGANHPSVEYLLTSLTGHFLAVNLYSRSASIGIFSLNSLSERFSPGDVVVSFLPIDVAASILSSISPSVKCSHGSIFLLSSTSVFSKIDSKSLDSHDYEFFRRGETVVENLINNDLASFKIFVLRLPLLWGAKRDRNIHRLVDFASRFGFIPISSLASGLRAPLHISQLSSVLESIIMSHEHIPSGFFTLMGPDVISYKSLCCSISRIVNKRYHPSFFVVLPHFLLKLLKIFVVTFRLKFLYGLVEKFLRQSVDLVYKKDSIFDYISPLPSSSLEVLLEKEYLS